MKGQEEHITSVMLFPTPLDCPWGNVRHTQIEAHSTKYLTALQKCQGPKKTKKPSPIRGRQGDVEQTNLDPETEKRKWRNEKIQIKSAVRFMVLHQSGFLRFGQCTMVMQDVNIRGRWVKGRGAIGALCNSCQSKTSSSRKLKKISNNTWQWFPISFRGKAKEAHVICSPVSPAYLPQIPPPTPPHWSRTCFFLRLFALEVGSARDAFPQASLWPTTSLLPRLDSDVTASVSPQVSILFRMQLPPAPTSPACPCSALSLGLHIMQHCPYPGAIFFVWYYLLSVFPTRMSPPCGGGLAFVLCPRCLKHGAQHTWLS